MPDGVDPANAGRDPDAATWALADAPSCERSALRAVRGQIDWWWRTLFRPRISGLTDDEYFWEPAPSCWTLRPNAEGQYFYEWPPRPDRGGVPPLTTIAWRMSHVGIGCLAQRWSTYFGDGSLTYASMPFPGNARDAVSFLDTWWDRWYGSLEDVGENGLWKALGPTQRNLAMMPLGQEDPFIGLVLHISRELMHHGAEISLLRDLYHVHNSGA